MLFIAAFTTPKGLTTKLQHVQDRAVRIVSPSTKITSWDSIEKTWNTRVKFDAFKSVHNLLTKGVNSHFKTHHHKVNTRGRGTFIFLLKMRTETERSHLPTKEHASIARKSICEETSI